MIFFLIISYASADILQFVNVVHRHGDRTPEDTYPTDPYPEYIWEEGMGQLTELGKSQLYDLGRYIRSRYKEFLPMVYRDQDIYVEASNYTRTVASANFLLAGLYQQENDWPSLDIPVHVIPSTDDNKIVNSALCPAFDTLQENVIQNELCEEERQKYEEILKGVSQYTGLNLNYGYEGLNRATTVYDTLFVEEKNGLTLPDWTAEFYPKPLYEILIFTYYRAPFYNTELKRLRCGPLIKDIIQHFDDSINGNTELKLWQYSGHDTTIGNVLICLNVFNYVQPTVASAVFLELYQDGNDDFNVLITYRKDGIEEILTVPGCSEYCPLDKFKELARDIIPDDWDEECNL